MDINGFGKASPEMIDDFEQHIKFSLPEDYKIIGTIHSISNSQAKKKIYIKLQKVFKPSLKD